MIKTLAELWKETPGPTVTCEGVTFHAVIFREVSKSGQFVARLVNATPNPFQVLRIDVDPGTMLVQGTESSKMVLRLDTSPDVVEVHFRTPRQGGKLTFYNAWIDEHGQTDR